MRNNLIFFGFALAAAAPLAAAQPVPVSAFRSVELRGGGNVTVRPGPVQRVTLLEGSAQITRFSVDHNGRLRIDICNNDCPRDYKLRVDIQSPTVPGLGISGGGEIVAANGFARQAKLSTAINGGGRIDAQAVNAASVNAAINGGGIITTGSSAQLNAAVNGGGLVRYEGNPQVTTAIRGGGAVTRAR